MAELPVHTSAYKAHKSPMRTYAAPLALPQELRIRLSADGVGFNQGRKTEHKLIGNRRMMQLAPRTLVKLLPPEGKNEKLQF